MNILYLGSHAILEYDQVRLWTGLGYDVFSIGAYMDPRRPEVDLRPAINAQSHPELAALVIAQRERHAAEPAGYPIIDWAKADLHQGLIDWADTIIVDCYPESWIVFNWPRIREKRVIWRTIGQSGPQTETMMGRLEGLQIVRYSPAEQRAYGPMFAGEDAMIRFAKDPADFGPWLPDGTIGFQDGTVGPYIANLAQHEPDDRRDPFLHWDWVTAATEDLPFVPAGPNSEAKGGLGSLSYDAMRAYLARARAYIYSGTVPASYTLGLIEAMMTGVPVVSIGPGAFGTGSLFEAHEIALESFDDPAHAHSVLANYLRSQAIAAEDGVEARARAIDLFGVDNIARQWVDFLGAPAMAVAA